MNSPKIYQFKIQWLFSAKLLDRRNCYAVIKALGAKNIGEIIFRDEDKKIISNYTGMYSHPTGYADTAAISEIKERIKNNSKIFFIELLKK